MKHFLLIVALIFLSHHIASSQTHKVNYVGQSPLFALKTNLLFDAALTPNIELEIPIGKHWSVAGEWIFPWWLTNERQNCYQLQAGNLEGRYWFNSPGVIMQPMLGWFAGLYLGAGYYDFESDKTGYQGEFQNIGLSGGYTHKIGRRLRLEYSLGVGFLKTKYRKYNAVQGYDDTWYLVREQTQPRKVWFGPTRAKVSLVWLLTHKKQ